MKKYLLGLFAVVLALGFSAFTISTKTTDTFYYFATNDEGTAFADPDTYVVPQTSHLCQGNFDVYCSVQIPDSKIEFGTGSDEGKIRPKHPINSEFNQPLLSVYEVKQLIQE